jgi:PTH1 family peptidyl-tRNA hydrolase
MDVSNGIKMVIGLGNPGRRYANTRHNVGFRVIDSLAARLQIDVKKKKLGAVLGQGEFADRKLILLKPWRFMNCSGQVVATAAGFYKVGVDDLLVITDDMALPPGQIRMRVKGSSGGHKGLDDIIEKLGTERVGRLRVGIGQEGKEAAVDFVLDKPTEAERIMLDEAVEKAREAVLYWVEYGIEAAMNKFNRRSDD